MINLYNFFISFFFFKFIFFLNLIVILVSVFFLVISNFFGNIGSIKDRNFLNFLKNLLI